MASLYARTVLRTSRRCITTTVRSLKEESDPIGMLTGLQRREVLAKAGNIQDPFNMEAIKRDRVSTKEQPYEIASAFDARIIGCVCHDDATHVNWMWLEEGPPRRCQCGHWFKLSHKAPV